MNDEALLAVRRPGARLLVALFWLNVPALYLAGLVTGAANAGITTLFGALICVVPTAMVFGAGRIDGPTRITIGLSAVSFPAMFVFLLNGHPWQMDMHMYFFAALAALAVLCDSRPIIAGAVLIALHHILFNYAAPGWVFTGSGDLPRVLFHAVIVIMQTGVLMWLTELLAGMIVHQAEEARQSNALRIEAESARARSEEAFAALEAAQHAAERQRIAEQSVHTLQEASERRRHVADALEGRLGAIVADLSRMANELSASKQRLAGSLEQTVARSGTLRDSHARAEGDVKAVTADTEKLVLSIHEVGRNATKTRETAHAGARATEELSPRMDALTATMDAANEILKMISSIATQSNMLALNATIEAARGGGDGRGFAVVAAEIKSLAAQTSVATSQVSDQLRDIRAAVLSVSTAIGTTSDSVRSIDASAATIAQFVQDQIVATTEIAAASEQMAQHIALAANEADVLSTAIGAVHKAMEQTDTIASAVSDRSRELDVTVQSLLSELRAA